MKLIIDDKIFEKYPNTCLGVVYIVGTDNTSTAPEIGNLLSNAQSIVVEAFKNVEISNHPTLKAWRRVYKDMDAESRRCSAEAMVRRTLKGDHVSRINNLVDLYNYISLKYILPVGGENIDAIDGDMTLRFADGSEKFIPLFATENDSPKPGEIVYADESNDVMCRRWNWRESEKTKLTEDTTNAILVVEGIIADDRSRVEEGTKELAGLVDKYCGGEARVIILDRNNNN